MEGSEWSKDAIFGQEARIPETGDGAGAGGRMEQLVAALTNGGGGGGREVKPLLLKLGLAVAFSVTGFLITQRSSRAAAAKKKKTAKISDCSSADIAGLKDDLFSSRRSEGVAAGITNPTEVTAAAMVSSLIPPCREAFQEEEEEGFLLPEFNQLINDIESPEVEEQRTAAIGADPIGITESDEEHKGAAAMVIESLKEVLGTNREKVEQLESAMREHESRLKIGAVEARLLRLTIEALQDENRDLRARSELRRSRLAAKLRASRKKIKLLKAKMKSDAEQAAELQRIMEENATAADAELVKTIRTSENEIEDLKRVNAQLIEENLKMEEAAECLREENAGMNQEIEQLQTGRCTDVEELVYLRWLNACLRHELRNYRPPAPASPESEKKARQLIREFAGAGDMKFSSMDFDFDRWSSHESMEECESATAVSISSSSSAAAKQSKLGLLRKLKGLVPRKAAGSKKSSSAAAAADRASCVAVELHGDDDDRARWSAWPSCLLGGHKTMSHDVRWSVTGESLLLRPRMAVAEASAGGEHDELLKKKKHAGATKEATSRRRAAALSFG